MEWTLIVLGALLLGLSGYEYKQGQADAGILLDWIFDSEWLNWDIDSAANPWLFWVVIALEACAGAGLIIAGVVILLD